MQPTSLRVYFNFQSNKKFFRDYFSTCLVSGGPPTRGRFVSRSFSDLPRLRYLSWHPASPLPLYFPHGASLSLTSLSFLSSQPPSLVLIVADSPYLLYDLSPAICYAYLHPRWAILPSSHPALPHLFHEIPRENDGTFARYITAARGR